MYVTLVHVHVKAEHVSSFLAVTRENHLQSVQEPGNLRFDVLQSADDATRFVLYEAYANEAAAAAHKQTTHYANWRDTVSDWMASPRQAVRYNGLYPAGGV
jgi:autoinducer 2-degrading protein